MWRFLYSHPFTLFLLSVVWNSCSAYNFFSQGSYSRQDPFFLREPSEGPIRKCIPQEELLPCKCLLKEMNLHVSCENSDLDRISSSMEILRQKGLPLHELRLVANRIASIPARFFASLEIKKIFLINNEVLSISKNAFAGLEFSLNSIYIHEPLLHDLPYETFDYLKELRTIILEKTSIVQLPKLSSLPFLEYFMVGGSRIKKMNPKLLQDVPSLQKIHISGSLLRTLKENALEGLVYLRELNFSGNAISWVHPGTFRTLERVEKLSLSRNRIEDSATAVMSARELRSLRTFDLSYNRIRRLPKGTFIDMPRLEEIDLSKNDIDTIEAEAFFMLPSLRKLLLNKNSLVYFGSSIFTDVPNLEYLSVAENRIAENDNMKLIYRRLPNLRFLDLSKNILKESRFSNFVGHSRLEELNLNHNQIDTLHRGAFRELPNLRKLHLKGNNISNYLEVQIWDLPNLRNLDISHNNIQIVNQTLLAGIPQLLDLDLSFNLISQIGALSFREIPSLRNLNISYNGVNNLDSNIFRSLQDLSSLDMSYNKLNTLHQNLFVGMSSLEELKVSFNELISLQQNTFKDTVKLSHLDISGNLLKSIPNQALQQLPSLKILKLKRNAIGSISDYDLSHLRIIELLDLSNNHLQSLGSGSFSKMAVLRELDLSVNYIQNLPPIIFSNLKILEVLNISNNFVTTMADNLLLECHRIRTLDISNNSLTKLGYTIRNLPLLQDLSLSHNYINSLNNGTFHNLTGLQRLLFNSNGLQTFEIGVFHDLNALSYLDLSNNNLVELRSHSFYDLPELKQLKLNQNQISTLSNGAFSKMPTIRLLELQDNVISHIGEFAFDKLSSVKLLNLSKNGLQEVPTNALSNVRYLDVLDLSWNYITEVRDGAVYILEWLTVLLLNDNDLCSLSRRSFEGLRSLRVLMLQNNQLRRLHLTALQQPMESLSLLDMSGNPFICDCHLVWLREYIHEEEERRISRLQRIRRLHRFRGVAHQTSMLLSNFPMGSMTQEPFCAGPAQYAGKPITQVPPEAFLCNSFNEVDSREEKCVPRYLNHALVEAGQAGLGLSPEVLNTLLRLSNLTEVLPSETENGPSYLDYNNPILLSSHATTTATPVKRGSQRTGLLKPAYPSTTSTTTNGPVLSAISDDFKPGDTPTMYAGIASSSSSVDSPREPEKGGIFGFKLPGIPDILGSIGDFRLPNIGLNVDWGQLPFGRGENIPVSKIGDALPESYKPAKGPDIENPLWIEVDKDPSSSSPNLYPDPSKLGLINPIHNKENIATQNRVSSFSNMPSGPGPNSGRPFLPGLIKNQFPRQNVVGDPNLHQEITNSEYRGILQHGSNRNPHNLWNWNSSVELKDSNRQVAIDSNRNHKKKFSSFVPINSGGTMSPIVIVEGPTLTQNSSEQTTNSSFSFRSFDSNNDIPNYLNSFPEESLSSNKSSTLDDNTKTMNDSDQLNGSSSTSRYDHWTESFVKVNLFTTLSPIQELIRGDQTIIAASTSKPDNTGAKFVQIKLTTPRNKPEESTRIDNNISKLESRLKDADKPLNNDYVWISKENATDDFKWPPPLGQGAPAVKSSGRDSDATRYGVIQALDKNDLLVGQKHISPSRSLSRASGIPTIEKVPVIQGIDLPPQYDNEGEKKQELVAGPPSAIIGVQDSRESKTSATMDWYYSNYHRNYDAHKKLPIGGNKPYSTAVKYSHNFVLLSVVCTVNCIYFHFWIS